MPLTTPVLLFRVRFEKITATWGKSNDSPSILTTLGSWLSKEAPSGRKEPLSRGGRGPSSCDVRGAGGDSASSNGVT